MGQYIATKTKPHQLAIGAIVVDALGRYAVIEKPTGLAMLTKPVEPLDALEFGLVRGLCIDWNMRITHPTFAGVTQCLVEADDYIWQKSIIWFRCALFSVSNPNIRWIPSLEQMQGLRPIDAEHWPASLYIDAKPTESKALENMATQLSGGYQPL